LGFMQNLLCHFWTFLQGSMNFGILNYFLGIKSIKNNLNRLHNVVPQSGPRPAVRRRNRPTCSSTAACCARAEPAQPGRADGPRCRCASAEGMLAAHLPRGRGQGHEGSGRGAPGKVGNGVAHRGGRVSVGWRGETSAATFQRRREVRWRLAMLCVTLWF
jgi:hypothetical protein